MNTILSDIKIMLGSENDAVFDTEITVDINNAITSLRRYGIGPINGFVLIDENQTWVDYIPLDNYWYIYLESIKSYIHLKTKMMFDPPTSNSIIKAITETILELEFMFENKSIIEGGFTNE